MNEAAVANFDELVGFDYTDEKEWRTFVEETVVPVYQDVRVLCELREWMQEVAGEEGRITKKDLDTNVSLKTILFGGLDDNLEEPHDGKYAVCRIYRDILELQLYPKDAIGSNSAAISFEKWGSGKYILWNENFSESLPKLLDNCITIMKMCEVPPRPGKYNLMEHPENLQEFLDKFLFHLQNATINHNSRIFLIKGLNYAYLKGLKKYYPRLGNETTRDQLFSFIGIEPWELPYRAEGEEKDVYTLYLHQEDGFAASVARMNWQIWEILAELKKKFPFRINDLPSRDSYLDALKKGGFDASFEEFKKYFEMPLYDRSKPKKPSKYLKISPSSGLMSVAGFRYYNSGTQYASEIYRLKADIEEVLEKLFPAIISGALEIYESPRETDIFAFY